MQKPKLVRDRIPEIIQQQGIEPITRIADITEYPSLLREKLFEEVHEFLVLGGAADPFDALSELADVLEVVTALAMNLGCDPDALEEIRKAKFRWSGGFGQRIVWSGNVTR